ncbi:MAG: response regulator [Patescibacteria group bacterium]
MGNLVWIIDDDKGILEVTQIVLQDAGLTVKTIECERELDEALKGELPNVILLDIMIAGIEGTEVAKRLKSDQKTKHIPIIMMSANTDLPEKAKIAGADSFIKKPYDIYDLEKKVKSYLTLT